MMTVARRMAETLNRLDLFDERKWFHTKTVMMLRMIEEELNEEGYKREPWIGLNAQLGEAQKEAERPESGARVLRLGGSEGSSHGTIN